MKFRIRTKVAIALVLPIAVLVGGAAYQLRVVDADVDAVEDQAALADAAIGPTSLTTELQNERNYTSLDVIGLADAATLEVASVSEARDRVDATSSELRTFLAGRDPIVVATFAPALEALDRLGSIRARWDDFDGPNDLTSQETASRIFDEYTVVIEAFFDASSRVAAEVDDTELRNGIEIIEASNRRGERLATVTRSIVLDALTEGDETLHERSVAVDVDRIATFEERIAQLAVGPYAGVATETLDRPADVEAREHFTDYLDGEDVDLVALLGAVSAGGTDDVTSAAEMAAGILAAEIDAARDDATSTRQVVVLAALGTVFAAIVITWAASRSITEPLRALRAAAETMVRDRLPAAVGSILETPPGEDVRKPDLEPIHVKTRDEVQDVVAALNEVQAGTLELAVDQAVLRRNVSDSFVNLGRRNQHLLDRQLEFITELEREETEPETLESLFRLDHLATRMRRNAESLLVLAGVESPRQWSAPVATADVVRAAMGEVEDYGRVAIRNLEPGLVLGSAAAGLSHILAELIENSLQFSSPEHAVEVKGRRSADGYVLAVDDNGIGMSADELERANRRLSGGEDYTVAPSRYLGHYVAGHLAARLGVDVGLRDSPAGGVTATVTIPASLLAVEDRAPESPAPVNPAPVDPAPVNPAPVDPPAVADVAPTVATPARDEEPAVSSGGSGWSDDLLDDGWRSEEPAADDEPDVAHIDPEPVAEAPAPALPAREPGRHLRTDDEPVPAGPLPASALPASLDDALEADRLPAIETLDDLTRAMDTPPTATTSPSAPSTPAGDPQDELDRLGLPRRNPGAQRPDVVRRWAPRPEPTDRTPDEPDRSPDESDRAAPADGSAFGFLQQFVAGASGAGAADDDHSADQETP